jgi:hypothetical protein
MWLDSQYRGVEKSNHEVEENVMDLIERGTLIENGAYLIDEAVKTGKSEDYKYGLNTAMTLFEHADNVDAVPLDMLCEWLAEYGEPCKLGIECEYAAYFNCMKAKECWEYVIKKWKEKLNADR